MDSTVSAPYVPFADIPVEHSTGNYVCTRYGLLFEGHGFFALPGIYLPDAAPIDDSDEITIPYDNPAAQPGRVLAEMPIGWWRAQCAFRGLNTEGEIPQLRETLKTSLHMRPMLDDLHKLELNLLQDFRKMLRGQNVVRLRELAREGKIAVCHTGPRYKEKKIKRGEGKSEGAEKSVPRDSRGGRRGEGRIRRRTKKAKPAFDEVLERFGTKPS